jgi:hypothetical protein
LGATDWARYGGEAYADPGSYLLWSLAPSWPLLAGLVVVIRRDLGRRISVGAAWAWWAAIAWLPWSWVLAYLIPYEWIYSPTAPLHMVRYAAGAPGALLAAAAGLIALAAWIRVTRPTHPTASTGM